MSLPTAKTTTQQLINNAVDTASLAMVYHDQAAALFNAIEALHGDPKHKDTITQLCAIGWLLSDEAGNAASDSKKTFEGVQS